VCKVLSEPQARSIIARLVDAHPRAATASSLTCWIGAILVLALHANGIEIRGDRGFLFTDSWLIGLGCVGVPVLVLNLLGRHLNPRILELIAAACFTGGIVVTGFMATGQSHMDPWTTCFLLILFLAMGIQALNGAYGLDRRQQAIEKVRAEEAARRAEDLQASYLAGIIAAHDAQRRRSDELSRLLELPTGEIQELSGHLLEELDRRHQRAASSPHSAKVLQLFNRDGGLPPTGSERE